MAPITPAPEVFLAPDIPATRPALDRVVRERFKFNSHVREILLGSGQQGYQATVRGLTDILVSLIDSGIGVGFSNNRTDYNDSNIVASLDSKIKQVDVIMALMTDLNLWSSEPGGTADCET